MTAETHLFIIWQNARTREAEILDDIRAKFRILKEYEIFWDEDKFRLNIGSFYAEDFRFDTLQETVRGKGAFLAVIVEDVAPNYVDGINRNVYDLKNEWRQRLGSFTIHGTDNVKQARHDICLLTGKSIADIISSGEVNGGRVALHQNLPCVDGWKSLEQVFYVLNETCTYSLLRGFANIPKTHRADVHGDIDFLVDNLVNFVAIIKSPNEIRENAFSFFNWIEVGDQKILFHPKFVGDEYYDKKWQKKILETRVLNAEKIYVPSSEMFFWSLLYHGVFHKENYAKYLDILQPLSKELGIEFKDDKAHLIDLLSDFLKKNNYQIALHLDNVAGHLEYQNIDASLIKKDPEFLFYTKGCLGSIVIEKTLIRSNPTLATSLIHYYDRAINIKGHWLEKNCALYSEHASKAREGELAWMYKKRLEKVVRTVFYTEKGELWVRREMLNVSKFGSTPGNSLLRFVKEKPRRFIQGKTAKQVFDELPDDHARRSFIEIYFAELSRKFAGPRHDILDGRAFDMIPNNCIADKTGFHFFDIEYEAIGGIDRSLMLWRNIVSFYDGQNITYELFCDRFRLEKKEAWSNYFTNLLLDNVLSEQEPRKREKITQLCSCLIPIKSLRRRFRNSMKARSQKKNLELFERYFR